MIRFILSSRKKLLEYWSIRCLLFPSLHHSIVFSPFRRLIGSKCSEPYLLSLAQNARTNPENAENCQKASPLIRTAQLPPLQNTDPPPPTKVPKPRPSSLIPMCSVSKTLMPPPRLSENFVSESPTVFGFICVTPRLPAT